MNFDLSQAQQAFYEKCLLFAKTEIAPHLQRIEEEIDFRLNLFQKMSREGLFALSIPKSLEGHLTDSIAYALAIMAVAKVDAGLTVAMSVTNMVAEAILRMGSEEQKQRYLSKIVSGKGIPAAFALTEKTAGSDAKNIQTQVTKEGDRFILTGEKQFISNGDLADFLIVFAKTDPGQSSHGISAFLVDRESTGFSVVKKERKLGLLSANLVNLEFDGVVLSHQQLLGPWNEGFKIALSSLDSGRISIAAQAVGIAEAAYEAALSYAKNRKQFDQPIAQFEGIGFKLANMHVKLSAAKLLLFKACLLKDKGCEYTLEASEAKLFCSEACNEIANDALQIHGGYGYVKDYPLEKYFRDARVTTLYEGTSEIQRLVISKEILKHS